MENIRIIWTLWTVVFDAVGI